MHLYYPAFDGTCHPANLVSLCIAGGATQLGKGGDDMEVAIKIMRLTMPSRKGGDDSNVATMRNEAIILTQARHENIVQLHAIGATQSTNTSSVFLVQTKINGPSLEDVVQSARGSRGQLLAGKGYRDVDAARWMLGIARGLHYLHSELNILHRDIKLANIRLSSNDTSTSEAVILDFGVSCKRLTINERTRISSSASLNLHVRKPLGGSPQSTLSTSNVRILADSAASSEQAGNARGTSVPLPVGKPSAGRTPLDLSGRAQVNSAPRECHTSGAGTFLYMAPEQRGNCNYDCEAEVYSMGLVMYELFNRSTIENVAGLEGYVGSAAAGALRQGWRPPPLDSCPPTIVHLIKRCTCMDLTQRPPVPEVIATLEEFIRAPPIPPTKPSMRVQAARHTTISGRAKRKIKSVLTAMKLTY